jgi:pyruvate ferredoxin oxidoreductase gamma subunit/2-oxoisovalerate ferredoxin oxidoreductase gamma subunit
MREIRFHGRGGQGTVVAAELLAQAAFLEGKWPQSFPFFGVERRGAPVTAYARIDTKAINLRTSITDPDIVVILDDGLLTRGDAVEGLKPLGLLLINTPSPPYDWDHLYGGRIAVVDATRIALAQDLGTRSAPIVNTAMLGALSRASRIVGFGSLATAIQRFVPGKPEANVMAAMTAYRQVEAPRMVAA